VEQGTASAVTALVVFAVVFAVLAVKVWPVIGRGLDERADKIKGEIAAAEAARQQAKDALAQYEKSLADARAEAQAMLEKTKQQQTALADELKAKSEAELSAMKDRARKDIEAAKRAAISEMKSKLSAQPIEASVKTARAMMKVRLRPNVRMKRPVSGMAMISAMR